MQAWTDFTLQLEQEFGSDTVSRWVRSLKILRFDACNLYLEAQDSFQVLWFDEHIRPKLSHFANPNKTPIKVHIEVAGNAPKAASKGSKKVKPEQEAPFQIFFQELDPTCTLEEFQQVDESRLAFSVIDELCTRLVNNKLRAMSSFEPQAALKRDFLNPIYLYGPTGSGKTHLLMAAAQKLRRMGYQALYARAELFTDHVVRAIRVGEMAHFRKTYRNADILLIDDVEVFGRKSATQEEFFHTFNTLHTDGKQIILSSNVAPQALQFIEPRLVSRFEWGIVLPLSLAREKEIIKILEYKARHSQFPINGRVVEFVAETFQNNPKSAVKALDALMLRSHLNKKGPKPLLTVASAKALLTDLIETEKTNALSSERIISSVAEHYSIPLEDLVGKSQSRECVVPRQLAMYLCRELLKVPYMKIGDLFQRDHSTVMSAVRQVQKQMSQPGSELAHASMSIQQKLS